MGIFRTNDPTQYDDVDGIIIDERSPAGGVRAAAANVAILAGVFQRGPEELTLVSGIADFHEKFGKSSFSGNIALKNKAFGPLKISRVVAGDAVKAAGTFDDDLMNDAITFTAKYKGAYGNNITVTIEDGTVQGQKYTIIDGNSGSTVDPEVYDNIVITAIATDLPFRDSKLVDVTVVDSQYTPENAAATALTSGDDGTVADTDYQTAIGLAAVENSGNVIFLDSYNATRNGYLKTHVAATEDKIAILAGAESDDRATTLTAMTNYRDTAGRMIYAYPWLQTNIDGISQYVSPASFMASLIVNTPPHKDPANTESATALAAVTGLKQALTRADYIALKDGGVASFEIDPDVGCKLKSGVTTQILSSAKTQIARRRMADYLTNSIATALKPFQNDVNSKQNRDLVKAVITRFDDEQIRSGILPGENEISEGGVRKIDTDTPNTADSIANGFFKIDYKRRIFSSMRFIVLKAEIGESVVVREGE